MDFEQLDALVNLIITLVPITLALAGTVFGLRVRRRAAASKEASITIVKFASEPETPAAARRRRVWQYVDVAAWLALMAAFAIFALVQVNRALLDPDRSRTLILLLNVVIVVFYAVIIWMYARTLAALRRVPVGARSYAFSELSVVLSGSVRRIARKSHNALRRLGADVLEIDLEHGLVRARRHFFFNLYRLYFDELTVRVTPVNERQCQVTLHSDGVMPSLARNGARNRQNLLTLINYITE